MLIKWLVETVLWLGVMVILLFVPAGTMNRCLDFSGRDRCGRFRARTMVSEAQSGSV